MAMRSLCIEVPAVPSTHASNMALLNDAPKAQGTHLVHLHRVIGQESKRASLEQVMNQCGGVAEVSLVIMKSERAIRFVGIEPFVLQKVGRRLGPKSDAPSLVSRHVHDHSTRIRVADLLQRGLELGAAVTAEGTEDIAGETRRVDAHQRKAGVPGRFTKDDDTHVDTAVRRALVGV